MITEIGIVAGEIWQFLDRKEEIPLSELFKGIDKPNELVLMSLGWLAREGHVKVKLENKDYWISLRK